MTGAVIGPACRSAKPLCRAILLIHGNFMNSDTLGFKLEHEPQKLPGAAITQESFGKCAKAAREGWRARSN